MECGNNEQRNAVKDFMIVITRRKKRKFYIYTENKH
jgi:hypothetical protein